MLLLILGIIWLILGIVGRVWFDQTEVVYYAHIIISNVFFGLNILRGYLQEK